MASLACGKKVLSNSSRGWSQAYCCRWIPHLSYTPVAGGGWLHHIYNIHDWKPIWVTSKQGSWTLQLPWQSGLMQKMRTMKTMVMATKNPKLMITKIVATLFNLQPMRMSESPIGEEWLKPKHQALARNLKEIGHWCLQLVLQVRRIHDNCFPILWIYCQGAIPSSCNRATGLRATTALCCGTIEGSH